MDLVTEILLCRPKRKEWYFRQDDPRLFRSAYSRTIHENLLAVVHDPGVLRPEGKPLAAIGGFRPGQRRTRQLRPDDPIPTVLHLLAWQGEAQARPLQHPSAPAFVWPAA